MTQLREFVIDLPFPPSVNTYWRHGTLANGKRQTMISKKGREFKVAVRHEVTRAGFFRTDLFNTDIAVSVELYMPDRRIRDIDNYVKATLDALCGAGLSSGSW
jgi:crossover junction endodeoxyribonuclease RusA